MNTTLRFAVPAVAAVALLASAVPGAQARSTAPVPANFQPAAASFSSPSSGVVLGGVGCKVTVPCRARLAATTNGGARWKFLATPKVWLPSASPRAPEVSEVVSVSARNVWLFGGQSSQKVWATHNGGARWRQATLPGDIARMAASAGTVYAVVSVKAGDELYRSPVGRDDWTRVGTLMAASDGLAVLGKAAWFGGSPTLWATMDGVHWHKHAFTCPSDLSLAGIAASSGSHVAFLCAFAEGMFHTAKSVLRSVNGGQTEHLAGTAPDAGDVYGFAVPPHTNVVAIAAVTPGPDYVYRSANGGKTWNSVVIQGTSGGVGLASLQFVSARTGWLIISGPASIPGAGLLRTRNSGLTWHAVKF